MCDAKASSSPAGAELTFTAGDKTITLRFATTGDVGGHIRIGSGDRTLLDRPLTNEVMPQSGLAEQPASGKGHE
jgi:hypothetical protein